MRKNQNSQTELPVESKHKGGRFWKSGKMMMTTAGLTLLTLGSIGAAFAFAGTKENVSTPTIKSAFPAPPTDTTVNWENDKPLYYEVDQNGTEYPKPELTLGDGTPAWCLGLGVALPNNTTKAQQSATNKILEKLTDEQKAIINNVEYLGRKAGNLEGYAEAQHATYLLLDQAGDSVNQTKDLHVKDDTLLHNAAKIKNGAKKLIKQAKKMRELPSFNNQTIQLIQGTSKTITDSKSVLGNFPYVKVNAKGVTEKVSGNKLTLKADSTTPHGQTKNAIQFQSTEGTSVDLPWFVFSTDGDDSGTQSQSVGGTQDPSKALASLNINVIGLGEATLTKSDADTGDNSSQGTAQLQGAVFGLFKKSDNKQVKWSDGQKGYPITLTAGTKADDTNVSIKMGADLKAGVKNLDNSKAYYWQEVEAPEGYSLSTTKYEVKFDSSSKFDDKTSNYIDNDKATDKVDVFNFMFTKVQDDNGSYTGLNGAEFTLAPKDGTKGKVITATSGTGTDSNGYTVNGLTKFDGEANHKAGNPSKDGIAIGNYTLHESKTPKGLKAINDVEVNVTTIKDQSGKITAYEEKFTDVKTKQVIDDVKTPVKQMKDNNVLVNVNLGQFTDKPETPVTPVTPHGHTQVSENEIEPKANQKFTDTYYASGLTVGETYTVKVKSAWDKQANREVAVKGELTFKATSESMTVKIPITVDATGLEGHDLTLLEDLFDSKGKVVVKNEDHTDIKETVHVKKPVTPTPQPETPKQSLPHTGEKVQHFLTYAGIAVLFMGLGLAGVYYFKKDKKSEE